MEPVDNSPLDLKQAALVIAVNVLMLLELALAMYFASRSPDDFSATFMAVFFGTLLPTLAGFFLLKRRLRR